MVDWNVVSAIAARQDRLARQSSTDGCFRGIANRACGVRRHPMRDENDHKALVARQRNFVSAIPEVIDPRSREASIRDVLESFATVAGYPRIESPEAKR